MEQKKLPNATISLVLGIISYIACCLSSGIGGIILAGVALFLANKDRKTYLNAENPEEYINYNQVKTARIIAIIGVALSLIVILSIITVIIQFGGIEGYKQFVEEQMQNYGL